MSHAMWPRGTKAELLFVLLADVAATIVCSPVLTSFLLTPVKAAPVPNLIYRQNTGFRGIETRIGQRIFD